MAYVGMIMREIERCPQCNIANPTLNYKHHYWDTRINSGPVTVWFAYVCASCQNLIGARTLLDAKDLANQNLVALGLMSRRVVEN